MDEHVTSSQPMNLERSWGEAGFLIKVSVLVERSQGESVLLVLDTVQ